MASLYLNPELEPSAAVVGARVAVRGDEAKHAVTVNRSRVGERIAIGNGDGLIVWGVIASVAPTELVIDVDEVRIDPQQSPALWLVQALAKGDRDEMAVQAATELGVLGVVPWASERSVTRWEGPKIDKGRVRWESIVREASKQSIRAFVPRVDALATTAAVAKFPGLTLVLDPTADAALSTVDLSPSADHGRITLVVGPEGGLSARELSIFENSGAVRVRLGGEILRTSTAGPAAIAVLNARLGRW
jgi:16S rRNA (uracil1498-N3)-methyltransferase